MNRATQLLERIREFPLDKPNQARPFSRRLADEQGWSTARTAGAIEEYRRFVTLAMTAGHPVCPSDDVDEVWHLHLLYTRDYWNEFCGKLLGRPLHHDPTSGGPLELARHRQMYAATLASYERLFGIAPPADLWPPVEARFGRTTRGAGAGISHAGTLHRWWAGWRRWPWLAAPMIMLPLAAPALPPLAAIDNPLELRGPQFLQLYFAACLDCRWRLDSL